MAPHIDQVSEVSHLTPLGIGATELPDADLPGLLLDRLSLPGRRSRLQGAVRDQLGFIIGRRRVLWADVLIRSSSRNA